MNCQHHKGGLNQVKSSRRQPRYRARFQTQTRSQLRRLLDLSEAPPQLLEGTHGLLSAWETLFRGLCLKSAQEIGATQDGVSRARAESRRRVREWLNNPDPGLEGRFPNV